MNESRRPTLSAIWGDYQPRLYIRHPIGQTCAEPGERAFGSRGKLLLRLRKVGGFEEVRRELSRAIIRVREILIDPARDAPTTLKSAHSMQQYVSSYVCLLETSDLKKRIKELEKTLKEQVLIHPALPAELHPGTEPILPERLPVHLIFALWAVY